MNEYICCLLGICCAFGSAEQFAKLVAIRMKHGAAEAAASQAARFDLDMVKGFRDSMMKG